MRKTLTEKNSIGRSGLRILAAVALTGSLAALGCTTDRTPGYGEPSMSTPAAGSVAPNAASTPGSANTMGTMPLGPTPHAMISSSPANGESASLDAIAQLRADEAYAGRVLGPAAPGDNSVTPLSMQYPTGQYVSPSLYANPQSTVNSSISSAPTPAIISGAAGDSGVAVVSGVTAPATMAGTMNGVAIANGVQNVGVTGVSNTTAQPITNTTANVGFPQAGFATLANPALATNNQVIGTGMANAPAPGSNVTATPVLSSVGPVGNAGIAAGVVGGSVLGVTNVTPAPTGATPTVSAPAGSTTSGMTSAATVAGTTVAPVTMTATTANVTALPATSRIRATNVTVGSVRVVTNATTGKVLLTNVR